MQPTATICRNCGNNFTGRYCNNCGEKIYYEHDKNIWHLLNDAFHFTTHFEGTLFNTLKAILTKPGKLSLDYCNGIRKKYFKPISFFLLLVIIYLLFPVFEGLNQNLIYYTNNSLYGEYALQKSLNVMHAKGLSEQELFVQFLQKGEKVSKFLLFIIIPIMALFSRLIDLKKRQLYFDHFIFSIEESSWLILWGFLLLPFIRWLLGLIGLQFLLSEMGILLSIMFGFMLHLFFAAQRFFKLKWYYNILFCLLYSFALAVVVQYLYKFILFFITINQI